MALRPRIFVSLTPKSETILAELVEGRYSAFKKASIASFALEIGLDMVTRSGLVPSGMMVASEQVF